MEIKINNTSYTAKIIFDLCGNLYFGFNQKLYEININGSSQLLCEPSFVKLSAISTTNTIIQKGKFKMTNGLNSLKGKAFREHIKELNKLNELEDYNILEDDNEQEFNRIQQYFPEDFEYFELIDKKKYDYYNNYDIFEYSEETPSVIFLSEENSKLDTPILESDDECFPLYETYIYNNDLSSGDLIFKTKFVGDAPIYRLRIYNSGEIAFRPIGEKENYYKLLLLDNNLVLEKYNSTTNNNQINVNNTGLTVQNLNLDS